MNTTIMSMFGAALLAVLLGWMGYTWVTTPIVQQSTVTGACVSVIPDDTEYTCTVLPPKYVIEWVK